MEKVTNKIVIGSVIIVFLIILVSLFVFIFMINNSVIFLYKTNWNIDIPNAKKVNIIDTFTFRDGEDFSILYYKEKELEKIVDNDAFKNIDQQSKTFIKGKLDDFCKMLDENNRDLFNSNIEIDTLLVEENYFAYVNKEDGVSGLLLILDYKNSRMFSFESIY